MSRDEHVQGAMVGGPGLPTAADLREQLRARVEELTAELEASRKRNVELSQTKALVEMEKNDAVRKLATKKETVDRQAEMLVELRERIEAERRAFHAADQAQRDRFDVLSADHERLQTEVLHPLEDIMRYVVEDVARAGEEAAKVRARYFGPFMDVKGPPVAPMDVAGVNESPILTSTESFTGQGFEESRTLRILRDVLRNSGLGHAVKGLRLAGHGGFMVECTCGVGVRRENVDDALIEWLVHVATHLVVDEYRA